MSLNSGILTYGKKDISYRVFYVDRKTLEIAVHPDGSVVIKAPLGTEYEEVRKIIVKRARWIKRQLDYFAQFNPRTPQRQYIGGETHLYLGRQYRLKIVTGDKDEIKLTKGYFRVTVKENPAYEKVKKLLEDWYLEKAADKFGESFERCWPHFGKHFLSKPRIRIRRMKKRWGSLSKNGTLTLNADLIRAPKECIDYVVTHELCHLQYHDHSPAFYQLLEKIMPDWEKRKHKMELALV
ncbi:M48 family metallopeptidase [Pelotomaculum isophthalicicum JI]|uniref:M48 family metallopeptidase n=1 Tax=Pelotomaculum isophthalicicum JI TaxID=947010 RepID=A0A9X4H330_9FIRM|nr:SprT family zinc-dependent metalloprotease [Pelotomaculum isophthalicicum]MDF9408821.1 M48 family metallopeptidase [Pelotomaculum isophthalicicum JI]